MAYVDPELLSQLNSAESDIAEASAELADLNARQSRGEIVPNLDNKRTLANDKFDKAKQKIAELRQEIAEEVTLVFEERMTEQALVDAGLIDSKEWRDYRKNHMNLDAAHCDHHKVDRNAGDHTIDLSQGATPGNHHELDIDPRGPNAPHRTITVNNGSDPHNITSVVVNGPAAADDNTTVRSSDNAEVVVGVRHRECRGRNIDVTQNVHDRAIRMTGPNGEERTVAEGPHTAVAETDAQGNNRVNELKTEDDIKRFMDHSGAENMRVRNTIPDNHGHDHQILTEVKRGPDGQLQTNHYIVEQVDGKFQYRPLTQEDIKGHHPELPDHIMRAPLPENREAARAAGTPSAPGATAAAAPAAPEKKEEPTLLGRAGKWLGDNVVKPVAGAIDTAAGWVGLDTGLQKSFDDFMKGDQNVGAVDKNGKAIDMSAAMKDMEKDKKLDGDKKPDEQKKDDPAKASTVSAEQKPEEKKPEAKEEPGFFERLRLALVDAFGGERPAEAPAPAAPATVVAAAPAPTPAAPAPSAPAPETPAAPSASPEQVAFSAVLDGAGALMSMLAGAGMKSDGKEHDHSRTLVASSQERSASHAASTQRTV